MDINRQIGTATAFAQIVWVAAGLFLYVTTPGVFLLTLSAAFFFVGGLAVAALLGLAFHGLQRGVEAALPVPAGAPAGDTPKILPALSALILVVDAIVIFIVASFAFDRVESYRTGVPLRYAMERENFEFSLKAFSVASTLEEEAKPGREAGQMDADLERRLVELLEAGVAKGRVVSNEFLTYLHPELPEAYRTQLVKGHEMLAQGRRSDNLPMQTEGNDLVRMFYQDFLPPRSDDILGKLGARLE